MMVFIYFEDKGEVTQKAFRTEFDKHKASFQKNLQVLSELDINDSVKIAVHEVIFGRLFQSAEYTFNRRVGAKT